MKKVFVILPLVLVLLLSCLPVMATAPGEGKPTTVTWNGCASTLKFNLGDFNPLTCDVNCVPVWLGYIDKNCWVSPEGLKPEFDKNCGVVNGVQLNVVPYINLLNNGNPVDIIKANFAFATYPQIAQAFMERTSYGEQYKIADPLMQSVIPVTVTALVPEVNVPSIKTPDKLKLVEVKVEGLLIVIEDKFHNVLVNHHIMRATGEYVYSETYGYPTNDVLRADRVDPNWISKAFVDVTYDPTQTTVQEIWDNDSILTTGQPTFGGYQVDLYYVAAKAAEGGEDVAGAKAQNVAAVQPTVQIPATGAADTLVLAMSSLALVVLGVFFKK